MVRTAGAKRRGSRSRWALLCLLALGVTHGCRQEAVSDDEAAVSPDDEAEDRRRAAACGDPVPWLRCVEGGAVDEPDLEVDDCATREATEGAESVETFHVTEPVTQLDYVRCVGAGICPEDEAVASPETTRPTAAITGFTPEAAKEYCKGLKLELLSPGEWRALDGCEGPDGAATLRCALPIAAVEDLSRSDRKRLRRAPYAKEYALSQRRTRPGPCGTACKGNKGGVPWIACDKDYAEAFGEPPKETDKGFDLSVSYKDAAMVRAILSGYQDKHPDIARLHKLGESRQGRPIWALRVNDDTTLSRFDADDKPALLLNGAHHGDELLSVDYALDALQQVLEGRDTARAKRWIKGLDLWFVPLVNPDGNHVTLHRDCSANMGRKNGRDINGDGRLELRPNRNKKVRDPMTAEGVDLNRNYPFMWKGLPRDTGSKSDPWHSRFRGPPGPEGEPRERELEPEAQALIDLADRMRFIAAISWHTDASKILSPYTIPGVKNPKPDVAWSVAETLLEALSENIAEAKDKARDDRERRRYERFRVAKALYKVDGTDQDWHFHAHGTLAYIFEGTHHNPADNDTRNTSIEVQRPLFGALADRILDGPMVHGLVRDAQGTPIAGASVTIGGYEKGDSDEDWTSRHDGRYERVLLKRGTYTLRATHSDGRVGQTKVSVGEGVTVADIVL